MNRNGTIRFKKLVGARRAALALLTVSALVTPGCAVFWLGAGAAVGAAGIAYVRGELRSTVQASPREVARAAGESLKALGIKEVSSTVSDGQSRMTGRTVNDRKISIRATSDIEGESRLSIRVGVFGDEALSRRIYEEIVKRL